MIDKVNHIKYAITGIGTDVGKTVVSAILAEALEASYWKPVQAGDLDNSDSIKIGYYTSKVKVLPEAFKLSEPMSPHAAAEIDGIKIVKDDVQIPKVDGNLIVEGAGGVMVPLNKDGFTFADAIESWNLPTIIVSRHYLGSINHSLLTAEVLKHRNVHVVGFIFVGDENKATEEIILKSTGLPMLARIPITDQLDRKFIVDQASKIKLKL
ncbi:MAG: dethiobiotin synthase [Crocinitomicaceae bacterium]|nr:dethiobiotin synthase [Crocinitomicaceae bacterium]